MAFFKINKKRYFEELIEIFWVNQFQSYNLYFANDQWKASHISFDLMSLQVAFENVVVFEWVDLNTKVKWIIKQMIMTLNNSIYNIK